MRKRLGMLAQVEDEPMLEPDEARQVGLAVLDILVEVRTIRRLLEDDGQEEEDLEE